MTPTALNIPIVPLTALGFVVFAFINFLKYLSGRDWNAAITQAITWGSGIVAIFLFSAAGAIGSGIVMLGHPLTTLDAASKIVLGLMASSTFGTGFNELKKALDNSQSSNTPPLTRITPGPARGVTGRARSKPRTRGETGQAYLQSIVLVFSICLLAMAAVVLYAFLIIPPSAGVP